MGSPFSCGIDVGTHEMPFAHRLWHSSVSQSPASSTPPSLPLLGGRSGITDTLSSQGPHASPRAPSVVVAMIIPSSLSRCFRVIRSPSGQGGDRYRSDLLCPRRERVRPRRAAARHDPRDPHAKVAFDGPWHEGEVGRLDL